MSTNGSGLRECPNSARAAIKKRPRSDRLFLTRRPGAWRGRRPSLGRRRESICRSTIPVITSKFASCAEAAYPSGKGEVCKTSMQRFESARRLHPTFALTKKILLYA